MIKVNVPTHTHTHTHSPTHKIQKVQNRETLNKGGHEVTYSHLINKVFRVMLAVDCFWPWDKCSFSKIKSLTSREMIATRNPMVAANSTQRSNICRRRQTLQWNSSGDQMSGTTWGYLLTSSHPWCCLSPHPLRVASRAITACPQWIVPGWQL